MIPVWDETHLLHFWQNQHRIVIVNFQNNILMQEMFILKDFGATRSREIYLITITYTFLDLDWSGRFSHITSMPKVLLIWTGYSSNALSYFHFLIFLFYQIGNLTHFLAVICKCIWESNHTWKISAFQPCSVKVCTKELIRCWATKVEIR